MPSTGIHNDILLAMQTHLIKELITDPTAELDPGETDDTIPGVIQLWDLQGETDPDVARISITLYENDPDQFTSGAPSGLKGSWIDRVDFIEVGGIMTWKRRFTVKARILLDLTREAKTDARRISSLVYERLYNEIIRCKFNGLSTANEYVSRGVMSEEMMGEIYQGGGPPDSYDFFAKIRWSVLTTTVEPINE